MLKYIVRRILIFIPTLFAISLIAFLISSSAPGDPVETILTGGNSNGDAGNVLSESIEQQKALLRHKLGLDLPVFYISFSNLATPDTLYRVKDINQHESLKRLVNIYGNWPQISDWFLSVKKMRRSLAGVKPDSTAYATLGHDSADKMLDAVRQEVFSLSLTYEETVINAKFAKLKNYFAITRPLGASDFLQNLHATTEHAEAAHALMTGTKASWKNWIPTLDFYGYNQYHRWLFGDGNWLTGKNAVYSEGIIRGDFGISYTPSQQRVMKTIKRAMPWSLLFTILSVFLAYLVSIPIGVQAAANRGSFFDRSSSVVLFMLFSLPSFFMATLLLMTFANPEVFDVFPANGVKPAIGYHDGISMIEKFRVSLPYLILPLVCYTYSSLAFLSRTMRVSMLEVTGMDFIRTAKAKGLSRWKVIYKHGLRNALLPIITVFSNIFPAAVGGSVILEFIFGIPGMGQEIITAIYTKDYPMIICVFTLSGFMTLVGYLVADILYAIADPRISYSKK